MKTKSEPITEIQPLAWEIDAISNTLPTVYALSLPAHWRAGLGNLDQADNKLPPFYNLYLALRGAAPEILHFAKKAFSPYADRRPPYWAYASTSVPSLDVQRFTEVIHMWLGVNYPGMKSATVGSSLVGSDLVWKHLTLTASLGPLMEGVLPDLVARLLLEQKIPFELSNSEGHRFSWDLRLIPSQSGQAELITWPPKSRNEGSNTFFYSYSLKFQVGSLPGSPTPLLLCNTGIRRWATWPLVYTGKNGQTMSRLTWGRQKQALIVRQSASWLTHMEAQHSLLELMMRQDKMRPEWVGRTALVLDGLNAHESIPDPSDLLANPESFISKILIPYDANMGRLHKVGTGLEEADRWEIYRHLSNALTPHGFLPVSPFQKTSIYNRSLHTGYTAKTSRDDVPDEVRRQAIVTMGERGASFLICSQDAAYVESRLLAVLGLTPATLASSGISIAHNPFPDTLFDELPDDATTSAKSGAAATRRREQEIEMRLPPAQGNTGVFMEMPNYQDVYHGNQQRRDPKHAVRLGLAGTGRHVQFFRPKDNSEGDKDNSEGDYEPRVDNACRDLLRHMGYALEPLYSGYPKTSLPSAGNLDIVALWVIRTAKRNSGEQTRAFPLVVHVPADTHTAYVGMPGTHGPRWLSYAEASLHIPDSVVGKMSPPLVQNFFTNALRDLILPRPTLLLLDEYNLRSTFPEICDDRIIDAEPRLRQTFSLGGRPCRMARIRLSKDGKVPPVCPTRTWGKYSGLYAHEHIPNLFYSIQDRPVTAQRPSAIRQCDPKWEGKPGWNPSTVEILPLCLEQGDVAEEWAWVVHRLRQASSHTSSPTLHPEPLHGLTLLEEYLPRIADDDDE